ncbi:MAG: zinc ribbon domain-containing protein [Ruminococcaceae bacterium]|nr:zinc ribbon domain-containing protein [Oscillospiraceae bacterium]
MFCPNCGKAVQDGVAFCPECGGKIEMLAGGSQEQKNETSSQTPVAPPSLESVAEPSKTKLKLIELANKKELRTNIALALLLCSLFAPIFSILGIVDLSAWRIINISVFNNVDIPGAGGASLSQAMAMAEAQIPASFDFGITLLGIGFYVFALSSIGVFIGNIRANKKLEERFALAGIISGALLFIAILIISGEIESLLKANMSGYDEYSGMMAYSEESMAINMVMEYLSPFKLFSVGYWGSMLLYVTSFVFNKKRTDA